MDDIKQLLSTIITPYYLLGLEILNAFLFQNSWRCKYFSCINALMIFFLLSLNIYWKLCGGFEVHKMNCLFKRRKWQNYFFLKKKWSLKWNDIRKCQIFVLKFFLKIFFIWISIKVYVHFRIKQWLKYITFKVLT